MRETRLSGSEGGAARIAPFLPLSPSLPNVRGALDSVDEKDAPRRGVLCAVVTVPLKLL